MRGHLSDLIESSSASTSQAAALLGLSSHGIWKAIQRGTLAATWDSEGRRYGVRLDDIERYRKEHLGQRGPRRRATA